MTWRAGMAEQTRCAEGAMSPAVFMRDAERIVAATRSPYPWEAIQHLRRATEAMARRVIWC